MNLTSCDRLFFGLGSESQLNSTWTEKYRIYMLSLLLVAISSLNVIQINSRGLKTPRIIQKNTLNEPHHSFPLSSPSLV
ncbi:uncharacterized protein BO97DRAFT_95334 [Aspergillus homomorphus CBS 101889]|uniref:Uncharacterized protein n=1 Tax=Aspergillus homomorphus (strain CBS 101889) TaxID=1450537 RepID=A0A395HVM5_ASPHC|nr:hypothetical protein BO97DRAFT_95334 [Aspergillus homomorphus CBS 101889]RAL11445.1 hypothetical protein BO97DRAFT_95334 [Aspergillus homomorphus CBS 101889]